jgi:peroxiredoxin
VGVGLLAPVLVAATLGACAIGDAPRPAERHEVRPGGPRRATVLAMGDPVPPFVAPGLRGGFVRWRDREGSPTVLVVWAAWCPYCQRLLPALARVAPDFPDVRVLTVTTSIGRRPGPTPQELVERHGLAFPVAVDDADNALARALGVSRYPTVYWVGRDGAVRGVSEGETSEAALRQAFAMLARAP